MKNAREAERPNRMGVVNTQFDTRPLVFHAQGHHEMKPNWPAIRDWFFKQPGQHLGPRPRISVITCNNGHDAMGLLESSCERLGIEPIVAGLGINDWVNARDKPVAICDALRRVKTDFTLYVDSRDGILIDDPEILVDRLLANFPEKSLVFGADRLNWPTIPAFKKFEDELAEADGDKTGMRSDFRYLNGGAWIARTSCAQEFFTAAQTIAPHPAAPTSEQGILKAMLPAWCEKVALDYRCFMIQNLGFVSKPIFAFA